MMPKSRISVYYWKEEMCTLLSMYIRESVKLGIRENAFAILCIVMTSGVLTGPRVFSCTICRKCQNRYTLVLRNVEIGMLL
jgi:hypothetical protein